MRVMRGRSTVRLAYSASALAALGLAASASAQSATVVLSHNDPDGIVDPGQTVHIRVHLTWTGYTLLGWMGGDAVASPDRGVASNATIGFNNGQVNVLNIAGVPALGSVRGFLASHPPQSPFSVPGYTQTPGGIDALEYDWTAPDATGAGAYSFDFAFATPQVGIRCYTQVGGLLTVPVPTTVTPASLTVTPAPSTLALLAATSTLGRRRRRL